MRRRLSEELLAILQNDTRGPESFSNTALLYMNRQTFEEIKRELVPVANWTQFDMQSIQLFGVPVMRFHGIPLDIWELVQRNSGELITSGNVWEIQRAPQLSDLGICQTVSHVRYPHLRDNSCTMWERKALDISERFYPR